MNKLLDTQQEASCCWYCRTGRRHDKLELKEGDELLRHMHVRREPWSATKTIREPLTANSKSEALAGENMTAPALNYHIILPWFRRFDNNIGSSKRGWQLEGARSACTSAGQLPSKHPVDVTRALMPSFQDDTDSLSQRTSCT